MSPKIKHSPFNLTAAADPQTSCLQLFALAFFLHVKEIYWFKKTLKCLGTEYILLYCTCCYIVNPLKPLKMYSETCLLSAPRVRKKKGATFSF